MLPQSDNLNLLALVVRTLLLVVVPVILASACALPPLALNPEVEAIRVTANPEAVRGCESLGLIDSGIAPTERRVRGETDPQGDAIRRLKLKADSAGANVVILLNETPTTATYPTVNPATGLPTPGAVTTSFERARGEAYRCP